MASRSMVRPASLPRELVVPCILCVLMIAGAAVTCTLAQVSYAGLLLPYFESSLGATAFAAAVSSFWWVVQLARQGADRPINAVIDRLLDRSGFLFLAIILIPVFYANYTAAKTAIPLTVGYDWGPFWIKADQLLFGADAWRIAARWLSAPVERVFELLYTVVWGPLLLLVPAFVSLNAPRDRAAVFYTTFFGTWFIGGFVLAYALSAAGPVFFSIAHPTLAPHFLPLREMLQQRLIHSGPVQFTEAYLASEYGSHIATPGAGISAMPSMHIAVVTIYVIMARKTVWLVPACCFWAAIFVFSAFSGYHYWWDGIVAVAVTVACWAVAERLHVTLPGDPA